jgi:hypothetical protein
MKYRTTIDPAPADGQLASNAAVVLSDAASSFCGAVRILKLISFAGLVHHFLGEFMTDHSINGPIRILRERHLVSLVANFKIAKESHGRFAFVTLFDDLCLICDFSSSAAELNASQQNERIIENLKKARDPLFRGFLRRKRQSGRIDFTPCGLYVAEHLVDLLSRTFGYLPLDKDALNYTRWNPEIWLSDESLGTLSSIVSNLGVEQYEARERRPAQNVRDSALNRLGPAEPPIGRRVLPE